MDRILIAEDELEMLQFLSRYFTRRGYKVTTAASGEDAWKELAEAEYDLVISDLAMEGMDGLDLLKMVKEMDGDLPFIIITGVGTIESAVEAIKIGAFHYVTKPFQPRDLEILARRAIEFGKLHRKLEKMNLKEEMRDGGSLIFGNNRQIQEIMQTIDKISGSDAPVLIQGETGTGKTVFARRIHELSSRSQGDFFTIDCSALTENLLESELFGHVKGAFTGAIRAKRGLLEQAQGGTVFLDEIGEMSISTQVKLLRAIQELEIKPVGGNHPLKIDVRFITATNRDLQSEVAQGNFREDLYYRLAVIPLHLPPLRQRKEEILLFVDHFVREFNALHNKRVTRLEPWVLQTIMEAPWKGNIRELKNVIERAVLLSEGSVITSDALNATPSSPKPRGMDSSEPVSLKKAVEDAEKKAIRHALAITKGNRSKAAVLLGIGRRTLYDKMAGYNL